MQGRLKSIEERKRGTTIGYPKKGIGDLGERAESWRHGAF